MEAALALALQTVALQATCSHCGKECASLKKCSRCKQASYCGAECQKAAWKGHKKPCALASAQAASAQALAQVPLKQIFDTVDAADAAGDWRGLLKWEGRLDELLAGAPSDGCRDEILMFFAEAHKSGKCATGSADHALSAVRLQVRRIEILGINQRFRDQGELMCDTAEQLLFAGQRQEATGSNGEGTGLFFHVVTTTRGEKRQEAERYFQQARDVGAAHGFFSVECKACLGLGELAALEGRHEEALELMQNALAASSLCEKDDDTMELNVLHSLTELLFREPRIDELEPLIPRYRAAAKTRSGKVGHVIYAEFHSIYASARLHEARGKPQEAEREVRALLGHMRDNDEEVQFNSMHCRNLLLQTTVYLKNLSPELNMSVAAQLGTLMAGMKGAA